MAASIKAPQEREAGRLGREGLWGRAGEADIKDRQKFLEEETNLGSPRSCQLQGFFRTISIPVPRMARSSNAKNSVDDTFLMLRLLSEQQEDARMSPSLGQIILVALSQIRCLSWPSLCGIA